jgi:hypothetical protein
MALRFRSLPDPSPAPAKAPAPIPSPDPEPIPARPILPDPIAPDPAPVKGERFDRVAYQRAYMRARRAKAKAK